MAAGIAALATLELGDPHSARGVFVVQRMGDGLSCACAHTAQARLMVIEGQWEETLKLAGWALDEFEDLAPWAARPVVIERLSDALQSSLQAVRDTAGEPQRVAAEKLLDRLEAYRKRQRTEEQ